MLLTELLKIRAVKLPWIFPEAALTLNGAQGNIQGNMTALEKSKVDYSTIPTCHLLSPLWHYGVIYNYHITNNIPPAAAIYTLGPRYWHWKAAMLTALVSVNNFSENKAVTDSLILT